MHKVRAKPLDTGPGLETGEACQRTSHSPQPCEWGEGWGLRTVMITDYGLQIMKFSHKS